MKPTIEQIKVDMDQLNKELRLKSHKQRHQIIKKYAGGYCLRCYEIPTKKVIYDIGDAKLIERYCDACYQKHKSGLDKRLKNINLT